MVLALLPHCAGRGADQPGPDHLCHGRQHRPGRARPGQGVQGHRGRAQSPCCFCLLSRTVSMLSLACCCYAWTCAAHAALVSCRALCSMLLLARCCSPERLLLLSFGTEHPLGSSGMSCMLMLQPCSDEGTCGGRDHGIGMMLPSILSFHVCSKAQALTVIHEKGPISACCLFRWALSS